ncbi:hypothetical protein [Chitinimonas lacunae]|uniref:Uncharacterized protein n=1 Tax=Chitinimonas lacunae TaxID=1963018 RepID=A0ABV8MME8_9NEIS
MTLKEQFRLILALLCSNKPIYMLGSHAMITFDCIFMDSVLGRHGRWCLKCLDKSDIRRRCRIIALCDWAASALPGGAIVLAAGYEAYFRDRDGYWEFQQAASVRGLQVVDLDCFDRQRNESQELADLLKDLALPSRAGPFPRKANHDQHPGAFAADPDHDAGPRRP